MPIIEVKQLTKVFGSDPKRALTLLDQGRTKEQILKEHRLTVGVNKAEFSIEQGEIFVIMGLSGSGKSTLVRLLNRLIEPTGGQVLFNGTDVLKMNPEQLRQFRRKNIGMVFQKFALFPHRTVLENAEYGLEIQGVERKKRTEMATASLKSVGLEGWENSLPDQLSGGMQQRVGLARVLANDPEILLMDEAFSALDPLIRKDMQLELLELQSKLKKTIVFITHDLDEALRIGDRIALMKDGSIVQIGTPEEILIQPANKYVERFVEDVDLSKVLTAAHVMKKPETISLERGPRVALQLMRDSGVSSLYLTSKGMKLLGIVTAEDALQALKEGKSLEQVMQRSIPTVSPGTLLNDLFEMMAETRLPVAVVDEEDRLKGIVIKGAVLSALAGNAEPEAGAVR
ncbi:MULTISPECIES: glycine betaine/L-proline ABC transporter ATP-binding protein [Paenibacillus]|uniref:quaternary amine ABC transporter ATP-binding protein n=1 Tax=Paenibacillus TaxID=44249 RepID=UPI00020D6B25|nr:MULTISPECIES: glycine betaine/L-proline ABC transporter ATP-binding protein [Paenibacillus]EGL19372.1 glycine betaine ABC transporter, ATP-binding protein OpuAA [Paenibacillus sp. HGF7]EPD82689.1 glycine betaine/L-proline transport ATP binding subunit [Paenibacillus sp. HGH0039]MBV6713628.1 glycine betaine/L-proline ABC transporter ATP-binding protein [Paenibacillus chitinolyticus]